MAGEDERLVVALEARVRDWEKNFERAQKTANAKFTAIEKRAQASAGNLQAAFSGASASIASAFSTLGGAGIIAGGGLAGIITTLKSAATSVADLAAEAQKAGVSFAAFQELKYATGQARVGVDALTDGLKEMQLRADEFIRTGAGSSLEAFKRLGYTAADLKKKLADPAALFEEIIEKMKGFSKAGQIRIADEIFGGTGGEQFVRLMDQGKGAIGRAREEARALGVILSDDVAKEAKKVAQEFDKLALRIEVALKSGVLEGAKALEDYKAEILGIAAAFGAVAAGVVLGPLVASLGAAAASAVTAGVQLTALNATILAVAAGSRAAALATAGLAAALRLAGGPWGIAIMVVVGAIAALALRQDQAKVSAEAHKKALGELDKAIADVKGHVPGSVVELKKLSAQHLENARTALKAAEAEYERQRALAAAGPGIAAAAMTAGLPGTAVSGYLKERADAAAASVARLQQAQKDLQEVEAKLGEAPTSAPPLATDPALPGKGQEIVKSAGEKVRALEAERNALTMTKQAAAEYLFMQEAEAQARQANIKLSPEQTARLSELAKKYGEVTAAIEKTREAQEALNELRGMVSSFFGDIRSGLSDGKSLADSFTGAMGNLANKLMDMATDAVLKSLFNALFPGSGSTSGGGLIGAITSAIAGAGKATGGGSIGLYASGGSIRGPGSGTSDSIPTMLSNGEFVVRASQAKKFMPLLEGINSGRLPHFAEGGMVGASARSGGVSVTTPPTQVTFHGAPAGTKVQEGDDGNGGRRLDVFFDEQVAASMRKRGSATQKAMGSYGARPGLVRR